MQRQQANVTTNALIQPLSETQASAFSGGATTVPPKGFERINAAAEQAVNLIDLNHCP